MQLCHQYNNGNDYQTAVQERIEFQMSPSNPRQKSKLKNKHKVAVGIVVKLNRGNCLNRLLKSSLKL